MVRSARYTPREHLISGEWPTGRFDDTAAEAVAGFVARLREAMGGRSLREVEALTDVSYSGLSKVLNGDVWPDAQTIARLEEGLEASLWVGPS